MTCGKTGFQSKGAKTVDIICNTLENKPASSKY